MVCNGAFVEGSADDGAQPGHPFIGFCLNAIRLVITNDCPDPKTTRKNKDSNSD
jgi:hypothetical protein